MRTTLALLLLAASAASAGSFRAAAVKIDITPENSQWLLGYQARRSTGVHDRLYHRIAAMDDGRTRFFLVSSDLALVSPSLYDEFCRELRTRTGIQPLQVWWTATHTHSAPEVGPPGIGPLFLGERYKHEYDREYTRRVVTTLIAGIEDAQARLAPARLAIGTGIARANINRRERNAKGAIVLGRNPEAPADTQIGLIRLERPDRAPIALIANYAMHGTVLGGKNLLISADAPGVTAEYVERKLGAPMLFINSAAGNVAPLYSTEDHFRHLNDFKRLLGDPILEANAALRPGSAVKLALGEAVIETRRKAGLGWTDELAAYSRTDASGPMVRFPVRFLCIGRDTVVWTAPLELFTEIATAVRAQSPFRHTFHFGYTNGSLAYLPTREAFAEGGYETTVCIFTEAAERDLLTGVLDGLRHLPR